MTSKEVDELRRELLIAAAAARKLSVALSIAWAQLTDARFGVPLGGTPRDEPGGAQKKNCPADQPDLPF